MFRKVTNFDQDFFNNAPGFQSIHARTLPGPQLSSNPFGWFDTTQFPWNGQLPGFPNTLSYQPQKRPAIHNQVDFFQPLQMDNSDETRDFKDRREITLTNDIFGVAKPQVQLKGNRLRVYAATAARAKSKDGGFMSQENGMQYETEIPHGFNLAKMSAKKIGGTLLKITIPKKNK